MSNIALDCLDYEVLYTKGAENKVADFLSRIESDTDEKVNDEVEQFERFIYDLPSSGPELVQLIREEQLKDQAIMFARDQVLKFGFVSKGRYRGQHLTISDGMLTRDGKILAPQAVTGSVLTMTHNKAHPGVRRTTFLVKEKFTWNGLSDNVRKFCRKCEICNRHKHRSGPREPITPITIASYPRQVIAYDVATLPWGFGNRYFLQIRDMFSKWVELVPMCNQTSHTIVEALVDALRKWGSRNADPAIQALVAGKRLLVMGVIGSLGPDLCLCLLQISHFLQNLRTLSLKPFHVNFSFTRNVVRLTPGCALLCVMVKTEPVTAWGASIFPSRVSIPSEMVKC